MSELLSLHYFHAGRSDKAWLYSRVAGERAREKFAAVEAVQFFRRAVEVSRRLSDVSASERADVLEALGDAETSVGEFAQALDAYRSARRFLPGERLRGAALLQKEALVDQRLDRLPQSMRTLTRGIRMLDGEVAGSDPAAVLGRRSQLEVWYAWCRYKQGKFKDTIRWATRAVSDAELAGDRAALAEAYDALFIVHLMTGHTPPLPYGSMALSLFEELDDLYRQARALNHLGFAATVEGRGDEAAELYRRARESYTRAGDVMGAAAAEYNIADLLVYQGRLDEAEQVFRRILPVFRSLGSGEWTAVARRELGRIAVRRGQVDEGEELLLQARAELVALGLESDVVESDAALVEVALARRSWMPALEQADTALARARVLDVATALRALLRHRGTALVALGRLDEARESLEQGVLACEEEGQVDLGTFLVALAAVARMQGDPAAEELERQGREHLSVLGYVGR